MPTIDIQHLTKRYGDLTAVDDVSFVARPGTITGFLGPNGAGKTTTLRSLLGLVRPDAGTATIDGVAYADLERPATMVGAVLDDAAAHPARSGRAHLRVVAAAAGIAEARIDEVLELVDLTGAASRRVGGYSLGMRRRLGLATALLGDPGVLVLDEPVNGLDPAGVRWLRDLLRSLADDGRTILVSSHLLGEVEHTADHVVIVDRGRLVRSGPLAELAGPPAVAVRSPQVDRLRAALHAAGIATRDGGPDRVLALDTTPEVVGRAIAGADLVVYELGLVGGSLEETFLALTGDPTQEMIR
jgi:ABC-2 type transport system ATP-binding protein